MKGSHQTVGFCYINLQDYRSQIGEIMADKTLKIQAKKYKEETLVVSCRIPKDLLKEIDSIAEKTGRTRNEIVTMLLSYGVKNTEIVDE